MELLEILWNYLKKFYSFVLLTIKLLTDTMSVHRIFQFVLTNNRPIERKAGLIRLSVLLYY